MIELSTSGQMGSTYRDHIMQPLDVDIFERYSHQSGIFDTLRNKTNSHTVF